MKNLVLLVLLGGCQLVYDFGDFDPPEIDPSQLAVDRASPDSVEEGAGCLLPENVSDPESCSPQSPGVAIVLEGKNFAADSTVILDGYGFVAAVVSSSTSERGNYLAFTIPIAVNRTLGAGERSTITVTVIQTGAPAQSTDLDVVALDEYRSTTAAEAPSGQLRFSEVVIDSTLMLPLNSGAILFEATSRIRITGSIEGDGAGCLGGLKGQQGGCPRGGSGATAAGGAGGGGNAEPGGPGTSDGGDRGGDKTTAEMLVPLDDVRGGGGGGGTTMAAGNEGGAGGAAIGFSSDGTLTVVGTIDVDGAAGGPGNCVMTGASGGGAAGAVFLRARSSLDASGLVVMVEGGPGGIGEVLGMGGCDGGKGSDGLFRVDAPSPQLASGLPEALRGPVAVAPTLIATDSPHAITVAGSTGAVYWLSVNGSTSPSSFSLEAATDDIDVDLEPGRNSVCLLVIEAGSRGTPESISCVDIAYLP